jgi:hypothetical protein
MQEHFVSFDPENFDREQGLTVKTQKELLQLEGLLQLESLSVSTSQNVVFFESLLIIDPLPTTGTCFVFHNCHIVNITIEVAKLVFVNCTCANVSVKCNTIQVSGGTVDLNHMFQQRLEHVMLENIQIQPNWGPFSTRALTVKNCTGANNFVFMFHDTVSQFRTKVKLINTNCNTAQAFQVVLENSFVRHIIADTVICDGLYDMPKIVCNGLKIQGMRTRPELKISTLQMTRGKLQCKQAGLLILVEKLYGQIKHKILATNSEIQVLKKFGALRGNTIPQNLPDPQPSVHSSQPSQPSQPSVHSSQSSQPSQVDDTAWPDQLDRLNHPVCPVYPVYPDQLDHLDQPSHLDHLDQPSHPDHPEHPDHPDHLSQSSQPGPELQWTVVVTPDDVSSAVMFPDYYEPLPLTRDLFDDSFF